MQSKVLIASLIGLLGIVSAFSIYYSTKYDMRETPMMNAEIKRLFLMCYNEDRGCFVKRGSKFVWHNSACKNSFEICLNKNYDEKKFELSFRKFYGDYATDEADRICDSVKGMCPDFDDFEKLARDIASEEKKKK